MRVPHRSLVIGAFQDPSDGEEVDSEVDHDARRGMAKVMDAQIGQNGLVARRLPGMFDAREVALRIGAAAKEISLSARSARASRRRPVTTARAEPSRSLR